MIEAISAALPHFDCLIDTARHHVGSSLVEICKRGKHLLRHIQQVHTSQSEHQLQLRLQSFIYRQLHLLSYVIYLFLKSASHQER